MHRLWPLLHETYWLWVFMERGDRDEREGPVASLSAAALPG
jgi:hypothetical protein